MSLRPRLLITMGDVAGVGPEIIARAWPDLVNICRPIVVGDPVWLERGLQAVNRPGRVVGLQELADEEPAPDRLPCLTAGGDDLGGVVSGQVSAAAGKAAYEFLCRAIELALAGEVHGIVTAPLNKEGLRAAGLPYPGHTEILAERTGVSRYGMVLHGKGLSVIHATLHVALRQVKALLETPGIVDKIRLLDGFVKRLLGRRGRLGAMGLNPHASDGGLFGDDEARIVRPAVDLARAEGIDVTGPWPADTLFGRARQGEFDGLVAMYHDQGHIGMKLFAGFEAVNVTVGLPIVRTSVAHGTAYDIAGRGIADASSLVQAVRVAARLAEANTSSSTTREEET